MIQVIKGIHKGEIYHYLFINDGLVGMYKTEALAWAEAAVELKAA